MKKTILTLLILAIFVLGLAACNNDAPLTSAQAQKVALTHLGITQEDATDIHTHVTSENGIPCYSFHISTADGGYTVIIHAATGEVLSSTEAINH